MLFVSRVELGTAVLRHGIGNAIVIVIKAGMEVTTNGKAMTTGIENAIKDADNGKTMVITGTAGTAGKTVLYSD